MCPRTKWRYYEEVIWEGCIYGFFLRLGKSSIGSYAYLLNVQRPLFFSFKIGLPSSLKQALMLSCISFVCTTIFMLFIPEKFQTTSGMGKLLVEQITFFIGIFIISFCWEQSCHLLQVGRHLVHFCCKLCVTCNFFFTYKKKWVAFLVRSNSPICPLGGSLIF